MSRSQRIVLVVAVLAMFIVVANTLNTVLHHPDGGWFMYAPDSTMLASEAANDGTTVRAAAVWLAAIGVWLGLSWLILRDRSPKG